MKIKIAIIGGGSVNWMRGLIRDIYVLKGVEGGEIRLVDPNIPHVTSVRNMILKYNEVSDKHFDVTIEEDRKKALTGCNFVITPIPAGDLPRPIHHICYLHSSINEMVVEAALKGDRQLLIEAMSLDPSTGVMDFSHIPDLCDDLLHANKQWLPRFFD